MKRTLVLFAFLFAANAAAAESPPERVVLPKTVVPLHYDLAIVPNAKAKTFSGKVEISLKVLTPTKDIVLNTADLVFKSVSLSSRKEKPLIRFNEEQQTAAIHFAKDLAPGDYTLAISYDGRINDSPAGLFALDYTATGGKKRALFTQFENSDARRFLPSWDEPGVKATFTLTATLPAGEMPISNMPVASEKALPQGLKTVKFQESPKMSSYLLFYGQGDFERISRKVGAVDVGVIFKRGDSAKASFALNAASEILPFYDSYFGTPYPLPKLDMIAGPGQSQFFGAMENWGAIFYFEKALLFDPKTSDEGDRRGAFITIAHEMAHQWFGDLVTMAWWDDLWLNEGFASWMEFKAADKLHPDWHAWLQATRSKEYALSSGVRAYMKKHAYGNTVTDDLWAELETSSGQPVAEIAHDFTLQPGVPLISVSKGNKDGITLTQSRFAVDASGKEKLSWHVPVTVGSTDGKVLWRGVVGTKPADVAVSKGAIVVVNAGQAGYFRTLYDTSSFAALTAQFSKLSAYDQLGLLQDSNALGKNGDAPVTDTLSLLGTASSSMDADVQQEIASQLTSLARMFAGLKGEGLVKAYGATILKPLLADIGWDAKPNESGNAALLRSELIEALGVATADPAIIAEARSRFAAFLANPASLAPGIRSSVLAVVAANASAEDWEKLHHLAKTTTDSMEQREYYRLLGVARDVAVAQKALDLSLTSEVPETLRPAMVSSVSAWNAKLAFEFATSHQKEFDALLEPSSRNQFYVRLSGTATDPVMLEKLENFAQANIPATARGIVVKVKAGISLSIKRRAEAAPKIEAWLTARCKEDKGATVCTK